MAKQAHHQPRVVEHRRIGRSDIDLDIRPLPRKGYGNREAVKHLVRLRDVEEADARHWRIARSVRHWRHDPPKHILQPNHEAAQGSSGREPCR